MIPIFQSVAFKFGSLVVSHPLKRVANWLKRKLVPFDASKILIEFQNNPNIVCNHENSVFNFYMLIQIQNFTPYELQIHSCECRPTVAGYEFVYLTNAKMLSLRSGARGQYELRKSLDYHEVKRVEEIFGSDTTKAAHFQFHISVTTTLGLEMIPPINKSGCITMCRIVSSKSRLRKVGV